MSTATPDAFDGADYYDCSDDPEELTHDSPDAAIDSWLQGWATPGCDGEALIRERAPIEVAAYALDGDGMYERVATRAYDADEAIALLREECPEWFE